MVDYFEALAQADAKTLREVAARVGELDSLLPAMLLLPTALQNRACNSPVIQGVLNSKLSERPAAVLVVYFDLLLLVAILGAYIAVVAAVQGGGSGGGDGDGGDGDGGGHAAGAAMGVVFLLAANVYFTVCWDVP